VVEKLAGFEGELQVRACDQEEEEEEEEEEGT
jgi:hypothetical protein